MLFFIIASICFLKIMLTQELQAKAGRDINFFFW